MELPSKNDVNLRNRLRSIGMSTFLKLYPIVRRNPEITVLEVAEKLPLYSKNKKDKAQATCLSLTRRIIMDNQSKRALELISLSRINKNDIALAIKFLSEI